MAAGKFGSASLVITLDDHGGTPRIITAHALTLGGVKISQITEENSPFGQAFEANMPVGKQKFGPVELGGNYDTSATTGPHVMFSTLETTPQDTSRTLVIAPGDSKTLTVEVFAVEYEVILTDGKLTGYKTQLVQAGLAVWA